MLMKKKHKYILYIFLLLIAAAGYLGWILFGPIINQPEEKYFYIHTGATYQDEKDSLIKKKINAETLLFDKVSK